VDSKPMRMAQNALLITLVATAVGCSRCSVGYPVTEITGIAHDGVPVFEFSACGSGNIGIPVRTIWVYRDGGGSRGEAPICEVRAIDTALDADTKLSSWTYGQTPGPRTALGCARLMPGIYDVHVRAIGTGVAKFQLDEQGNLKRLMSLCH
jgi:hypothetical protein